MNELKGKIITGYEKLLGEYEGKGIGYEILVHPYFSTGAFKFAPVANSFFVDPGGFTRFTLLCPQGQKVELFSYAISDTGAGAGLATGTATQPVFATDAETNIEERHKTNEEDFAIEGISLSFRGWRVSYPSMGATVGGFTDAQLLSAIKNGDVTISDVSAQFMPPELVSPLSLEDVGAQVVRGKVSVQPSFNRKVVDHIARFDKFPEGGANSYLRANGEPSSHNYFKLHEGFVWRQSNADTDKLFSLNVIMEDNCYIQVTQPSLYQSTTPADTLGNIGGMWLEFTMWLHGRAFYIPSGNI